MQWIINSQYIYNFIANKNTSNYILKIESNNVKIINNTFSGNCGNYIRVGDNNNITIENNLFDGTNSTTVSPVVLWNSKNNIITNNRFIDNSGFNIELIYCEDSSINNNNFINTFYNGNYIH